MSAGSDFWSRRKAAVRAEEAAQARAAREREAAAERARLEARSDEEILAELNLPDPDALAPGDDVTGFMASAVPERLRRRALRRLWRLDPALANVDGLVDYGEDFTDAATVAGALQTAYEVGRGMLKAATDGGRGDGGAAPKSATETATAAMPAPPAGGDGAARGTTGPGETGPEETGPEETEAEDDFPDAAAGRPAGQGGALAHDAPALPAARRMRFVTEERPA